MLVRKKGERVPVEHTSAPVLDKDGGAIGRVIVLRDRSESGENSKTPQPALSPSRGSGARTKSAPPRQDPIRRGSVLVVDDEVAVANAISRMLRNHHVVIETDPRRALARLLEGERFDVVFCDLLMPELSGIDFYRSVVASAPDLAKRIVFMTGGDFTARSQAFLEEVGNVSVAKPFTIQAIRTIVSDYVK
jgi:CheY-like chemotaxis protein